MYILIQIIGLNYDKQYIYIYKITKRKPRFLSEQEFIDICKKLKYTESESLNLYNFMQQYTKDNYYVLTGGDCAIMLFDYKFKYTITIKHYYEYLKKFNFLINHNLETEFINIGHRGGIMKSKILKNYRELENNIIEYNNEIFTIDECSILDELYVIDNEIHLGVDFAKCKIYKKYKEKYFNIIYRLINLHNLKFINRYRYYK